MERGIIQIRRRGSRPWDNNHCVLKNHNVVRAWLAREMFPQVRKRRADGNSGAVGGWCRCDLRLVEWKHNEKSFWWAGGGKGNHITHADDVRMGKVGEGEKVKGAGIGLVHKDGRVGSAGGTVRDEKRRMNRGEAGKNFPIWDDVIHF